ncbi:hypothetical protein GCM10022217_32490 [Chryseobacterium ginsenosidimutans]
MYAYNWQTKEFEINYNYYEKAYLEDLKDETKDVSETEFNEYLYKLKQESH